MKSAPLDAARLTAPFSLRLLGVLYGGGCYLVFLASFLYAIGFVGNFVVRKSIDSGDHVSLAEALPVNLLLLSLFATQHSVMARPAFKRWWTLLLPPAVERSTYVLASSLLLVLLFWQWRPMAGVVWKIQQPVVAIASWGLFIGEWLIVLTSTLLIDHFDLFGLRQMYLYATGKPYLPPPFRAPALYRFVRHPIMLGFVIAFWATPVMTWGHLFFAGMTTAYIVVGIRLEERDLKCAFGNAYEDYRKHVSMIVPWVGRRQKP